MHLRLDRVDALLPQPRLQRVEIVIEPPLDARVTHLLEHASTEAAKGKQGWNLQDCVLAAATPPWVGPADRLIGLEQRHEREAEGVFHPRAPEAVELAAE